MSVIKCRLENDHFLDPSKPSARDELSSKISFAKIPKIGPQNHPKKSQITVVLRETDSWLDSQNIHMDFVQILVMQVLKRKMKNVFFWNAFQVQLITAIPAKTLFIKNVKRVAI